jgi:succinylarginine dihydrolase
MRFLRDRGFVQGILPPHERPHLASLRNLGFTGKDDAIMRAAHEKLPQIFSSLCSSSSMWAANAATVSPSFDSLDSKVHISPANLVTMLHRSIEADFAHRIFSLIFANADLFSVHPPLLAHDIFSDEGAANHNRLAPQHGMRGLQIFVYGKETSLFSQKSIKYPARQSKIANVALAMRHRLHEDHVLNIEQNHVAIDHGAFHNDVVAVANQQVLLCHELAFADRHHTIEKIRINYEKIFNESPLIIEISNRDLPIDDAVMSYIFNSQLLSKPDGTMLLFAPQECQGNARAHAAIARILDGTNPIDEVCYFDVSESMANGGGPACLRLRLLLTDRERKALKGDVVLTDQAFDELARIINTFYVDELTLEHFFDASFLHTCQRALEEIASVIGLGAIYDFQRTNRITP